MRIVGPNLLNLVDFHLDPLIHLIVIERVEHLVEVHFGRALDLLHVLVQRGEEVVKEVLI